MYNFAGDRLFMRAPHTLMSWYARSDTTHTHTFPTENERKNAQRSLSQRTYFLWLLFDQSIRPMQMMCVINICGFEKLKSLLHNIHTHTHDAPQNLN